MMCVNAFDGGRKGKKIWNHAKKPFWLLNPLKRLKTGEGIVGKACRIQAEYLEKLGKKLGKGWNAARGPERPSALTAAAPR
jgi:hypothetical protein